MVRGIEKNVSSMKAVKKSCKTNKQTKTDLLLIILEGQDRLKFSDFQSRWSRPSSLGSPTSHFNNNSYSLLMKIYKVFLKYLPG